MVEQLLSCRPVGLVSVWASHMDEERGTNRSVRAGPGQSIPGIWKRNVAQTQKQLGNILGIGVSLGGVLGLS